MIDWQDYHKPFPHLVGMAQAELMEVLRNVLREFPDLSWPGWEKFNNQWELKYASQTWQGPHTRTLVDMLSDLGFLQSVAKRLGINGQISSSFVGGGYHCIPVGGYLGTHVDFNQLQEGVYRRANILLYLNEWWKVDEGGELVLGLNGEKSILPEFGTVVAFPTTESSWHGHPTPTLRVRRSFAIYLYSDQPSSDYSGLDHTTIFT